MEDSIFTKIIKGEVPSHKVYEDDETLAFLDIHPVAEGHVLVIPKKQVEFVWDLELEDYTSLMATVKKVALRLRVVIKKPYVGELVTGTDVPHAHVHLIPFNYPPEMKRGLDGQLNSEPDHEALSLLAKSLWFED